MENRIDTILRSPVRVLAVLQGCGGGIGRVESLVEAALAELGRAYPVSASTVRKLSNTSAPMSRLGQTLRWDRGRLVAAVMRCCLLEKPDLVIFSHLNLSPLALAIRALRPGTRMATIAHGVEAWERLDPLTSFALRRMHAVWAVSGFTKSKLVDVCGVPESSVRLLPNALSPEQTVWLRNGSHGAPASRRVSASILSVARLDRSERQKGIDDVLQALPRVIEQIPEATYAVVGAGGDLPRLQSVARQLSLDRAVKFLGQLTERELLNAYAECDVFVLPSAKEGFGLVFVEAMAAGKPVIAADAGGTSEVVVHGRTGLLVRYGDRDALATALVRLLSDKTLGRRMGAAGRRLAEERFSFEHFLSRFTELFAELAERDRSDDSVVRKEH